ncbi:unnamed protein product [Caenorhabditis auriculariae]|uniref:Uncharacterized protein n=1 Tax=Caenorhabditis auriculariae TaxID=2777116 RepID=A0A8S1GUA1_9PELO|nr:unnamed protein product [Caenorhabditis auriculariae]
MGSCSSCVRLMLDAESDVKIHVIEPTSINGGGEQSVIHRETPAERMRPTLEVPQFHRPRREEKEEES